jgi:D-alanyl-D-alanine dipeptidase
MYFIKRLIAALILMSIFVSAYAELSIELPNSSQQLLLVTSQDWTQSQAQLQRYQRVDVNHWHPVGNPIPVILGENGIAENKREGDLKTPAGVFLLGSAFGFGKRINVKLPYMPITKTTVCVDDVKSRYYNQIIDSSQVNKSNWRSGEQMWKEIVAYKLGIVVNYNAPHPIAGAGSCIFIHIWKSPHTPTTGCIATSETDLKKILGWLNLNKSPVVVITKATIYL